MERGSASRGEKPRGEKKRREEGRGGGGFGGGGGGVVVAAWHGREGGCSRNRETEREIAGGREGESVNGRERKRERQEKGGGFKKWAPNLFWLGPGLSLGQSFRIKLPIRFGLYLNYNYVFLVYLYLFNTRSF